ncbi:MAG: phosphatase PAP2 family protein [Muribaculaceae bacterium]|jgi:membrane-associated phospholipid phosphatase|nr:phosphatase PAP2 family protein [Muribaculaceae bacterium]MCX4281203.1 phosphatase PAP2 family protein [Muribaculaceae bacterium]ROS84637.1 phosphatase PAP2 family protein [Muribaculaceae bacterium Isolate-036 (Harlan)]RXE68539.1 phosphatase PAP2 family protein [Muribaculaceae bacterium Isolate-001 (NCI)]
MIKKIRNIITVMLLMGAGALPAQAQTYFEPAAKDVVTPTGLQKNVSRSTDIVMLALPVATLAGVLIERDWDGLVQGIETAGATAAATLILKYAVCERRPDGSDMHSFPSAHSAVSFATAAFLQRRYGWAFGAPAYALAAYVGWGRVYSGKHHWWDVVAGGAIGAASAYIFTKPFAKKHNLQVSPVSDGRSVGVYASMEF